MGELVLRVEKYDSPDRWRWVLTEPSGRFVADHEVRLHTSDWRFAAFTDLYEYLRWRDVPDRRIAKETEIVEQVGDWIGAQVLGPIGAALVERAPATVRLIIPDEARLVAYRPLELARVNGRPLALQRVSLVLQIGGDHTGRAKRPVEGRLRVLALFSLPVGSTALNLRKERFDLARLLSRVAATHRRAIELRVLQYGVTEERLRELVEDGDGWDVVHISGHGDQGGFLLENRDGTPRPVTSDQLAAWLEPLGERVKLAVVSACSSAALTAVEHLQLLGLKPVVLAEPAIEAKAPEAGELSRGALAAELTRRLGCAVLAMRYPVTDDFAIALTGALYERLIGRRQPLVSALGLALSEIVAVPPSSACPPLSVAAPALFGAQAVKLKLAAPEGQPDGYRPEAVKLSGFPPQPERFVGRVAVMAAASEVLAPESRRSGLVLHGMAGAGKTFCATELAYTHADTFPTLVWYKAPNEEENITCALTDFAFILDNKIPGLTLRDLADDERRLGAFLPELTELVENQRILVVVDNAESLLTETGRWRDARWGRLIEALTAHEGFSRLIITTRNRPASLNDAVHVEAVHALSRDEAVLLARELPNLRALMDGTADVGEQDGRRLAVRVLAAAQGHPKLLELADKQTADPERLNDLAAVADRVWSGSGRGAEHFFASNDPVEEAGHYLHILHEWTSKIVEKLPTASRDLFHFLCCLEPSDRTHFVVAKNWTSLRNRLGRSDKPPSLDDCLTDLVVKALLEVRTGTTGQPGDRYELHPEIAMAGRVGAGAAFQGAIDRELSEFWVKDTVAALDREPEEGLSGLVVHAALSAVPYLMRRELWGVASEVLGTAINRDDSRNTAMKALPILRRLLEVCAGTDDEAGLHVSLARALKRIDPAEAERRLRDALDVSLCRDEYRTASVVTGDLIELLLRSGRGEKALQHTGEATSYCKQAGMGPWTQLYAEVNRLRTLLRLGRLDEFAPAYLRLEDRLSQMPAFDPGCEGVSLWQIRESLCVLGMMVAISELRWIEALDLYSSVVSIMRRRNAPPHALGQAFVSGSTILTELGRLDEARSMLLESRTIFEAAGEIGMLSNVFNSLAGVETARDNASVAVDFLREALRYGYAADAIEQIVLGHSKLGAVFASTAHEAEAVAHLLAAALLTELTRAGGYPASYNAPAAGEVLRRNPGVMPPLNAAKLCDLVSAVPGVKLDRLLARLDPTWERTDRAAEAVIAAARNAAMTVTAFLAEWEPCMAALLATEQGNHQATTAFDRHLHHYAENNSVFSSLTDALRRIRQGERDLELLGGPDGPSKVVAKRALEVVSGETSVAIELWPAMPIANALGAIVLAALGDRDAAAEAERGLAEIYRRARFRELAPVLGRILAGNHGHDLADELDDVTDRAVITMVLDYIGRGLAGNLVTE